MRFKIVRNTSTPNGTFGVMLDGAELPVCVTLENPWIDNLPRVSCIPLGLWLCERTDSPKFGNTFRVVEPIPGGRTHILFHKGNTEFDTSGCILLGSSFGHLSGIPAILQSNPAFNHFMGLVKDVDKFELAIIHAQAGLVNAG